MAQPGCSPATPPLQLPIKSRKAPASVCHHSSPWVPALVKASRGHRAEVLGRQGKDEQARPLLLLLAWVPTPPAPQLVTRTESEPQLCRKHMRPQSGPSLLCASVSPSAERRSLRHKQGKLSEEHPFSNSGPVSPRRRTGYENLWVGVPAKARPAHALSGWRGPAGVPTCTRLRHTTLCPVKVKWGVEQGGHFDKRKQVLPNSLPW